MTRVKPGQRQRARAPKVRTGCSTCKIRRVKCDEGKPECSKCVSTHRKCDGYPSEYKPPSPFHSGQLQIAKTPSLFIADSACGAGLRSLQFFQERAGKQLGGFFPDDLWGPAIIRLAVFEPSIGHALQALSSFHECLERTHEKATVPSDCKEQARFALAEYNLAIKGMLPSSTSITPTMDIHLMACFIFISIESIQGNHVTAVRLLQRGLRVFTDFMASEEQPSSLELFHSTRKDAVNLIQQVFTRMEIQAIELLGQTNPSGTKTHDRGVVLSTDMPDFKSLHNARDAMNNFWHRWLNCPRLYPENDASESERRSRAISNGLQQWTFSFERFMATYGSTLAPEERRGVLVLRLMRDYFNVLPPLISSGQNTHMYDSQVDLFKAIVDRLEDILTPCTTASPSFSPEIGVVPPLFGTAHRCRDPVVRRRALHLLKTCNRREGLWDSTAAAKIAGRIIDLEEGCHDKVERCEDVGKWSRISLVDIEFTVDGLATVRYLRTLPDGKIPNDIVETIPL